MRSVSLAALLAIAAGCGAKPNLVPLSGRVVLAGQGVTAGSLTFYPDGAAGGAARDCPVAQLQSNGSFDAATFPHGAGVPPGTYKVVLDSGIATRLKKPLYADPAKTPWSLTVPDAGVTDLVLEVK